MKLMTNEEIKAMLGTEFKYVFSSRTEMHALVAAFDPGVGFTALATSFIGSNGKDFSGDLDENGNMCLLGYTADDIDNPHLRGEISRILRSIRCLGYYKVYSDEGFGYASKGDGDPTCSFNSH